VSRARAVLRTVLLALAVAFGVGFAIGTWLRCAAERPAQILGAAPAAASGPRGGLAAGREGPRARATAPG
jgi:hypothetical protein